MESSFAWMLRFEKFTSFAQSRVDFPRCGRCWSAFGTSSVHILPRLPTRRLCRPLISEGRSKLGHASINDQLIVLFWHFINVYISLQVVGETLCSRTLEFHAITSFKQKKFEQGCSATSAEDLVKPHNQPRHDLPTRRHISITLRFLSSILLTSARSSSWGYRASMSAYA